MASKVTELTRLGVGTKPCDSTCRVCFRDSTRYEKVSADRLWHWSLANPGKNPFKS